MLTIGAVDGLGRVRVHPVIIGILQSRSLAYKPVPCCVRCAKTVRALDALRCPWPLLDRRTSLREGGALLLPIPLTSTTSCIEAASGSARVTIR